MHHSVLWNIASLSGDSALRKLTCRPDHDPGAAFSAQGQICVSAGLPVFISQCRVDYFWAFSLPFAYFHVTSNMLCVMKSDHRGNFDGLRHGKRSGNNFIGHSPLVSVFLIFSFIRIRPVLGNILLWHCAPQAPLLDFFPVGTLASLNWYPS